eukprot:GHVP01001209.1.p1 GENE.GHVP01001209.1~~GHVP01001209.1.p1  ORF type:complete len:358 (+),score=56.15 GHVP01001209.1:1094-2167(+)
MIASLHCYLTNTQTTILTWNNPLCMKDFFREKIIIDTILQNKIDIKTEEESEFLSLITEVMNSSTGEVSFICKKLSISHHIEYIPFITLLLTSKPIQIIFNGVTNPNDHFSIDTFINVHLPILKNSIKDIDIYTKVITRSYHGHSGKVIFRSTPIVKIPKMVQIAQDDKIKEIKGLASSIQISSYMTGKLIKESKIILKIFTNDIYIHSDASKVKNGHGLGLSLYSVSNKKLGFCYSSGAYSYDVYNRPIIEETNKGNKTNEIDNTTKTEELAKKVSYQLLREIEGGGLYGRSLHLYVLLMMTMSDGISCVLFGKIKKELKEFIKIIKKTLKINIDIKDGVVCCKGIGKRNNYLIID